LRLLFHLTPQYALDGVQQCTFLLETLFAQLAQSEVDLAAAAAD
jgi:hypothetical protein